MQFVLIKANVKKKRVMNFSLNPYSFSAKSPNPPPPPPPHSALTALLAAGVPQSSSALLPLPLLKVVPSPSREGEV